MKRRDPCCFFHHILHNPSWRNTSQSQARQTCTQARQTNHKLLVAIFLLPTPHNLSSRDLEWRVTRLRTNQRSQCKIATRKKQKQTVCVLRLGRPYATILSWSLFLNLPSFLPSFIHSFIHPFLYWFIDWLIDWFIYLYFKVCIFTKTWRVSLSPQV